MDRDVATKELLLRVEEMDSRAMQDFLVEIKLMSALRNKRVVQFLGVTYFDETLYLVTVGFVAHHAHVHSLTSLQELMQYGSLRDVLVKKGKNLSWKLKTKLLVDAAMGMCVDPLVLSFLPTDPKQEVPPFQEADTQGLEATEPSGQQSVGV